MFCPNVLSYICGGYRSFSCIFLHSFLSNRNCTLSTFFSQYFLVVKKLTILRTVSQATLNLLGGLVWPTGHMFGTSGLTDKFIMFLTAFKTSMRPLFHCASSSSLPYSLCLQCDCLTQLTCAGATVNIIRSTVRDAFCPEGAEIGAGRL